MNRPRLAKTHKRDSRQSRPFTSVRRSARGLQVSFTSALPPVRSATPEDAGNRRASRYDPPAQPHRKTAREDKTDRLRRPGTPGNLGALQRRPVP
ncbi:hypothetical protein B597_001505 [Stutzerimonas stutzeri KOS6]|uniref:Uncharacterized protein n=1 Tax=Stutzerimonas stutzeri KOS6 TaxID=1218352 RepID=A0A061JU81_STUST|nr:hypothetical protein B597_001505 [Stutzerimonas stutzeri KOS6]